jgi:hypothetical protein
MVAQCEASWAIQQIGSHFAARDSIDAIMLLYFQKLGVGRATEGLLNLGFSK